MAPRNAGALSALAVGLALVALASVPSHESFVDYLSSSVEIQEAQSWARQAVSAWQELTIALLAESDSYLIARAGRYRGETFLGCFGCWLPVPALPFTIADQLGPCARALCTGGFAAHESFALLCLVVFALWHILPHGLMYRHFTASLAGLRAGRAWTLLTSAISHSDPLHLAHNLVSLFSIAPQLAARARCHEIAELLILSALASSCASLAWARASGGARHSAPSLGASGVVLALAGARATLMPSRACVVYGVEMPASHALLAQLGLDCALDVLTSEQRAGGRRAEIDVAAHAGGALCGWWYARTRWRGLLWFG